MSQTEYMFLIDAWADGLTDEELTEYEYARTEAKAYDAQEEYFFMKGWAARAAV